jgi:hypothetical protein
MTWTANAILDFLISSFNLGDTNLNHPLGHSYMYPESYSGSIPGIYRVGAAAIYGIAGSSRRLKRWDKLKVHNTS